MHPTNGRITQEFGTYPQASGEGWGHTGRDYAGKVGDEVRTIADGTVIFADWCQKMSGEMCDRYAFVRGSSASGIVVLIQHDGWVSVSAHLNETHLNPGAKVKRGQRIGSIGMTGRSLGAHLHYECISHTGVYTPMFGRYAPAAQIAHEDAAANSNALRTVTADVGMIRVAPNHHAPLAPQFPKGIAKGAKLSIAGFVAGSDPFNTGDNAWLKTKSGYFIWANGAGNDLRGLVKL